MGKVVREHEVGGVVLARLMKGSDLAPTCRLCVKGRLKKKKKAMAPDSTSVLRKSRPEPCPFSLILKPVSSIPPYMPMLFKLLPYIEAQSQ